VKLLLDTHVLLWALAEPQKLPARVEAQLRNADVAVYVSAVSTWEIAIKTALGKLRADLDEILAAIGKVGFSELPVTIRHTAELRRLPHKHRDPFDRLLAAQALCEGLALVTHDEVFQDYPVSIFWA